MSTIDAVPRIEIPLIWEEVELVKGGHFNWHRGNLDSSHEMLIAGPKVYRWLMRTKNNDIESCYIGESVDFRERLNSYRRSFRKTNGTNKMLINAIKECEDSGGTVTLEFLGVGVDGFKLNGISVNKFALGRHEVRLMMESISIAIFLAQHPNLKLVNHLRKSALSRSEPELMKLALKIGRPALLLQLEHLIKRQALGEEPKPS